MNNKTDLLLSELDPLVGATIEELIVQVDPDDDEEYVGLQLVCKDGVTRHLVFLSDDEGNGPGSFDITEAD